jgi:hypothetical protein
MPNDEPELLYYPNFRADDLSGIKRSLLLYDRVHVIAPESTPHTVVVLAEGTRLEDVPRMGALGETLETLAYGRSARGESAVNIIYDSEITQARSKDFLIALNDDLADPDVQAWERRWKARHEGHEVAWYVLPSYLGGHLPVGEAKYGIEPVHSAQHGELYKLPFLVGMSFGLSEALWAAVDRGLIPFTDDPTSEEFLMLRLNRGWVRLATDRELQRAFGLEQEIATQFATAALGTRVLQATRTLGIKVPETLEDLSNRTFEEIIALRNDSDQKQSLKAFRDGLAKLVMAQDLWNSRTFREFEDRAYKIVEEEIRPAFEVLERKKFSTRDLITPFDVGTALKKTIEKGPELFARAVVPAAATAGGLAPLLGVHVVPSALLGLGCGLAAEYVGELVKEIKEKVREHRAAQFLLYPKRVRERLAAQ